MECSLSENVRNQGNYGKFPIVRCGHSASPCGWDGHQVGGRADGAGRDGIEGDGITFFLLIGCHDAVMKAGREEDQPAGFGTNDEGLL